MAWCRQATSHYLNQCLATFVCHYLGANELICTQTAAELTDFFLVVCMAFNLIPRKHYKNKIFGRRRSYIYPTWQCRIAISSTLIRGLCYQSYSFARATPWGTPSVEVVDVGSLGPRPPVSSLCFADHGVKQSIMHVPGYAAASATSGRHKTMLGESHHVHGIF